MKLAKRAFTLFPKTVWVAMIVGLIVHVLGLFIVLQNNSYDEKQFGSENFYIHLAVNLEEGRGFVYEHEGVYEPELFRTPGLPFLMSFFIEDGKISFTYFFLITIVSALLIPFLVYYIARTFFDQSIASIATWLYVLEPLSILFSWTAHTEVPLVLLMLSGFACLIKAKKEKSIVLALCSGIFLALSLYIRPVVYIVYIAVFVTIIAFALYKKDRAWELYIVSLLTVFIVLFPWMSHMKKESGVYALTASGWGNVYMDFTSSIRAAQNGTKFLDEKKKTIARAEEELGISIVGIKDPSNSAVLRNAALKEVFSNLPTVIKMETAFLFGYFTNTSYQLNFGRAGLYPEIPRTLNPTGVFLSEGFKGLPKVFDEMKKLYFVPLIERIWGLGLFLLAVVGAIANRKRPIIYLILFAILLAALSSTAIGFGVQGRLRIPVLPFYFMLAALGIHYTYTWIKAKRS